MKPFEVQAPAMGEIPLIDSPRSTNEAMFTPTIFKSRNEVLTAGAGFVPRITWTTGRRRGETFEFKPLQ